MSGIYFHAPEPAISTYWAGEIWEALLNTGDWNYAPPVGYGMLEE